MRRYATKVWDDGSIDDDPGGMFNPLEPVTILATADLERLLDVVQAARNVARRRTTLPRRHVPTVGALASLDMALIALDAASKEKG